MKNKHGFAFNAVRDIIIAAAVITIAVACVCMAIAATEKSRRAENAQIIENGVRRAAVECYAAEGIYPEDVGYLIKKYDLFTDDENFIIYYSPISSNIMPNIKVIAK